MGRRILLVTGILLAVAVVAGRADAKFSYFTLEFQPPHPTAGRPVQVLVRLWRDGAHTQPDDVTNFPSTVPNLFCIAPAGSQHGAQAHCSGDMVSVSRTGPATYAGTVTFPRDGHWEIVPFPAVLRPISPGYPTGQIVDVGAVAPSASHPTQSTTTNMPTWVWLAGALVVLTVAGIAVAERRRRRTHVNASNSEAAA